MGFFSVKMSNNSNNSINELPFWRRISIRQILSTATLCLGAVFLITFFVDKNGQNTLLKSPNIKQKIVHNPNEIREQIFATIEPERIASTLRLVTKEPHVAGTEANRRVAENIVEIWRKNGIERVQMIEYDVLLSYPNWTTPNRVSLLSEMDGNVLFKSTGLSPDLLPHDGGGNDYKASIQWVAFSANGTVEGEPIYCHYGRREDFERLDREFGISNLKGKIAIIRYGKLFRGDKVFHAQERGASGVILFSDPGEVIWNGPEGVFPNMDEMPSVGVQRGSLIRIDGDALTPLLPARNDFYKERTIEKLKANKMLPTIPVVPLSYGDMRHILGGMDGPKVPKEWQGGLEMDYRIGRGNGGGKKVRVEVHSSLEIKKVQNVIGIIEGSEEPDSWVMLGNHFDAWVFGSLDPNSGTAILAEIGRAFAETIRKSGWRPKRTLVFCAWDAEEHGLIGSTEFVQEFAELLRDRAVVYLNLDLISANQTLNVLTVPSIYQAVTDAAKFVENPNNVEREMGRKTVFDSWRAYFPPDNKWLPEIPSMGLPGGASDYMSFLNFLAIPVVDFTYRNASWHAMNGYPLYHSRYEVPFVNEHIFDHHNLGVHKAVGQYWAEMARSFADSPILPINATTFAQKLLFDYLTKIRESINDLNAKFPSEMGPALTQMAHLERQCQKFLRESRQFEMHSQMVEPEWANRRLRKLDQCFMNPAQGMVEIEKEKRHVLFSLSAEDNYSTSVMTAVSQKIQQMAKEKDAEKRKELGGELALQLTVIQYSVLCATNILKPFF